MVRDKAIYKNIFEKSKAVRGSAPSGQRDIMLIRMYCTIKDDATRHEITHKIIKYSQSLEDNNFEIHFADREHSIVDEKGERFSYSRHHLVNKLDIDKLLE